jgi:hypothetical protein
MTSGEGTRQDADDLHTHPPQRYNYTATPHQAAQPWLQSCLQSALAPLPMASTLSAAQRITVAYEPLPLQTDASS